MEAVAHGTEYAQAIFETIDQPILVLDEGLNVESANPAFCRKFATAPQKVLGRPLHKIGRGEWNIPGLPRRLREVLSGNGRIEDFRVTLAGDGASERTMLLHAHRLRRQRAADRILFEISDITEHERLCHELEDQRELDDKLIDSVREGFLILGRDRRVHSASPSFYKSFGGKPRDVEGRLIYELGNGQWDIPELHDLLERVLPRKIAVDDVEVKHEFEGIGRRVMLLNARSVGHDNRILLAIRDITEQRRQQEQQEAFAGELQHRVKNILSNVRAVAMHTQRSSVSLDSFFEAFEARLEALARAQDLLVRNPRDAASLRDIVTRELAAVGAREGAEYTIEGPPVRLAPEDARAVAMTIHELSTNAKKHGALKARGGRIEVGWHTRGREGNRKLIFRWRERGVRIVDRKPPRGFGRRVIEESLPHMLGGTVELTFHRDGVCGRLEFPIPDQDTS